MTRRKLTACLVTALLGTLPAVQSSQAQLDAIRKLAGGANEPPKKKVACLRLKGEVLETPVNVPPIFGGTKPESLKSVLERLGEARRDNDVVAVVVDLNNVRLGLAQMEELGAEMRKFRVIDKDLYIHADHFTNGAYALATGASHISVVPTGEVWLTGIYGETPYVRGTLDMMGVIPDFLRCEDCAYKSAAEILMRTGPSPEAAEMRNWLFDGLYESFVSLIAKGRGKTPEEVRGLIDKGPFSAEQALKAGLIDSIKYRQDFVADLEKKYLDKAEFVVDYGGDEDEDIPQDMFAMFQFMMKVLNPSSDEHTEPSVAIVYVEGTIVPGEAEPSPFGPAEGAYSTTIRKALDEAADDDSVKAVVLRVNSPGGSALASEIIMNAGRRVKEKKPFVVSMGNVAGSGGYYVSCLADTIFADPGTITASIGVLGGKFVTTGMWQKLGMNWHPNQRGEMAAILASADTFNEEERSKMRDYMEEIYDVFTDHVAKGRGEKLTKPLADMAGGRVYTGAQALELGLVDKLGGLQDAIKFAADKAGVSDYQLRVIPEPPSILDMFMGDTDDEEFTRTSATALLGLHKLPIFQGVLPTLAKLDPMRVRAFIRMLQRIELVHTERVITMMPEEYVIR